VERVRRVLELDCRSGVGIVVIQDRSYFSAPAYQCVDRPIGDVIGEQESFALKPDTVVLMDLPVREAVLRQRGRPRQEFELDDVERLQLARRRYLEMAALYGFRTVDASKPAEEIAAELCESLWAEEQ
jgi:dTMP kinase